MEIISRNTNTVAETVYRKLREQGVAFTSRNGPVLRFMEPVTICLHRPWERVNFSAIRDANPFFHLIEAMAMLAPVNSAPLMTHFAKSMAGFTDDGRTYNAFYGSRAREWVTPQTFAQQTDPLDQLSLVVKELIVKPDSRQCVVQLWDPTDLVTATKDKACNLCLLFDIVPGCGLHGNGFAYPSTVVRMTSFNRSNDAVLGGVTGANIVHLSFFHEYVANCLGIPTGSWWHVSNNLHAYTEQNQWIKLTQAQDWEDLYGLQQVEPMKLVQNKQRFDRELTTLMETMNACFAECLSLPDEHRFDEPFLGDVVVPVFDAWQAYKRGEKPRALTLCNNIEASDWRVACRRWITRRLAIS
jgi:thymidylate synthase